MSRRNTDAITIHSILGWIEDNLESPLSYSAGNHLIPIGKSFDT